MFPSGGGIGSGGMFAQAAQASNSLSSLGGVSSLGSGFAAPQQNWNTWYGGTPGGGAFGAQQNAFQQYQNQLGSMQNMQMGGGGFNEMAGMGPMMADNSPWRPQTPNLDPRASDPANLAARQQAMAGRMNALNTQFGLSGVGQSGLLGGLPQAQFAQAMNGMQSGPMGSLPDALAQAQAQAAAQRNSMGAGPQAMAGAQGIGSLNEAAAQANAQRQGMMQARPANPLIRGAPRGGISRSQRMSRF